MKFPAGKSRTLKQRPCLIGKNLEAISSFLTQINRRKACPVLGCGYGARIAVGENSHARFQQRKSVFPHGFAGFLVLGSYLFRFGKHQLLGFFYGQTSRTACCFHSFVQNSFHPLQRPGKVNCRRPCAVKVLRVFLYKLPETFNVAAFIAPDGNIKPVACGNAYCRCAPNAKVIYGVPHILFSLCFYVDLLPGQPGLVENHHFVICKFHRCYVKYFQYFPPWRISASISYQ